MRNEEQLCVYHTWLFCAFHSDGLFVFHRTNDRVHAAANGAVLKIVFAKHCTCRLSWFSLYYIIECVDLWACLTLSLMLSKRWKHMCSNEGLKLLKSIFLY